MSNPSIQNVHVNRPLENLAVAYMQSAKGFIADKVFSVIGVDKASNLYYTFPKETLLTNTAKLRAPGSLIQAESYTQSTDSYSTQQYADGFFLADEIISNADLPQVQDQMAVNKVMQSLMIQRDKSFATSYMAASKWTFDKVGDTDFDYFSDSSADLEKIIDDAKSAVLKATGMKPNVMVVGYEVHLAIKRHPLLIDRIKYTQGDRAVGMGGNEEVQKRLIADFFGLDEYIVAEAINNTGNDGGTFTGAYIVGKNALLCYRPATPGLLVPAAGYIFNWLGAPGTFGISMTSRYDADRRGTKYEGVMNYDMKLVGADLGYFFGQAVP